MLRQYVMTTPSLFTQMCNKASPVYVSTNGNTKGNTCSTMYMLHVDYMMTAGSPVLIVLRAFSRPRAVSTCHGSSFLLPVENILHIPIFQFQFLASTFIQQGRNGPITIHLCYFLCCSLSVGYSDPRSHICTLSIIFLE